MWIYSQETGRLWLYFTFVSKGYSGYEDGKNHPGKQSIPFVGPIPRGRYKIGKPYDSNRVGPFAIPLIPIGHNCCGRTNFLFHGDSASNPGKASRGCIIMSRDVRNKIHESNDSELLVIE